MDVVRKYMSQMLLIDHNLYWTQNIALNSTFFKQMDVKMCREAVIQLNKGIQEINARSKTFFFPLIGFIAEDSAGLVWVSWLC